MTSKRAHRRELQLGGAQGTVYREYNGSAGIVDEDGAEHLLQMQTIIAANWRRQEEETYIAAVRATRLYRMGDDAAALFGV